MFYCDDCAKENEYPTSIGKSMGKCEICGKYKVCNNIPIFLLPKPKSNLLKINYMYSAELIREVKELYPNSSEMHQLAENGGAFLGRYLDDSSPSGFPIDKILLATSLDEIQKEARIMKRKVDLYRKWCKEDPRPKMY
jgi:hypothetical protein